MIKMRGGLWCFIVLTVSEFLHGKTHDIQHAKPDTNTYLFAYGAHFKPLSYINTDGQLMGFSYDLVRTVCHNMNRTCEHMAIYEDGNCWDKQNKSNGLNNRWFDACVGYMATPTRQLSYGFVGHFASEPSSNLYARFKSSFQFGKIGFVDGSWTDQHCLERHIHRSLAGNCYYYSNYQKMAEDLHNEKLDAMFASVNLVGDDKRFVRVWDDPLSCSTTGASVMTRKDMAHNFRWFTHGLKRVRQNGEYKWLCNISLKDGDPDCLDEELTPSDQ